MITEPPEFFFTCLLLGTKEQEAGRPDKGPTCLFIADARYLP